MREALMWIEFREFIVEGEQFPHTETLYVTLGITHLKFNFNPKALRAVINFETRARSFQIFSWLNTC